MVEIKNYSHCHTIESQPLCNGALAWPLSPIRERGQRASRFAHEEKEKFREGVGEKKIYIGSQEVCASAVDPAA